jgi:hypothetical protein
MQDVRIRIRNGRQTESRTLAVDRLRRLTLLATRPMLQLRRFSQRGSVCDVTRVFGWCEDGMICGQNAT